MMKIALNSRNNSIFFRSLDDQKKGEIINTGTWDMAYTRVRRPRGDGSIPEFRYHRQMLENHPLANLDISVVMDEKGIYRNFSADDYTPLEPQPVHATDEWQDYRPHPRFYRGRYWSLDD